MPSRSKVRHPRPLTVLAEFFLLAGGFCLGFALYQIFWTDHVANTAQAEVIEEMVGSEPVQACGGTRMTSPAPLVQGEDGDLLGVLLIPRLGDYAVPVYEGAGKDIINGKGIGHYSGTQELGAQGNAGLAGHRTTYGSAFRDIDQLEPGDEVIVRGEDTCLIYTVLPADDSGAGHKIVKPWQNGVLDPVPEYLTGAEQGRHYLTLTTCDPLYARTNRLIVWAELTGWTPVAKDAPEIGASQAPTPA